MQNILTFYVKNVKNLKENRFGKWFSQVIEESGLKKGKIADEAGVNAGSLSRHLNGEGLAKETAIAYMEAVNRLSGKKLCDTEFGLSLLFGISAEKKAGEISDIVRGYNELPRDFQPLALNLMSDIIRNVQQSSDLILKAITGNELIKNVSGDALKVPVSKVKLERNLEEEFGPSPTAQKDIKDDNGKKRGVA